MPMPALVSSMPMPSYANRCHQTGCDVRRKRTLGRDPRQFPLPPPPRMLESLRGEIEPEIPWSLISKQPAWEISSGRGGREVLQYVKFLWRQCQQNIPNLICTLSESLQTDLPYLIYIGIIATLQYRQKKCASKKYNLNVSSDRFQR